MTFCLHSLANTEAGDTPIICSSRLSLSSRVTWASSFDKRQGHLSETEWHSRPMPGLAKTIFSGSWHTKAPEPLSVYCPHVYEGVSDLGARYRVEARSFLSRRPHSQRSSTSTRDEKREDRTCRRHRIVRNRHSRARQPSLGIRLHRRSLA